MALFEEEPRKKKLVHEVGQDLSTLSVADLDERIDQLRAEIARIETERAAKGATRNAADALFKR